VFFWKKKRVGVGRGEYRIYGFIDEGLDSQPQSERMKVETTNLFVPFTETFSLPQYIKII
jgi:hypothetical protein